ncbi:MAG: MYG1 family protein [Candidatus Pacebacteria bacterium]|nr:MYG1 family protein [Candidatus Paceibacterota bacterium]
MQTPIKKLVTHNGSFHTDDIFAAAALSLLLEKRGETFEIIRSRDESIIASGDYVFDVGGIYDQEKNRFDHHQLGGAGQRENSIKYSSFGLVWKKFGVELCGSNKVADMIDFKVACPIDSWDNGIDIVKNTSSVAPYLMQHVFFAFYPTWREEDQDRDAIFPKCVDIAKMILSREIIQASDMMLALDKLTAIYQKTKDKRIIVLDDNYPFEFFLHNFSEPLYAIYPRKTDGTWGVKAIRSDIKTFQNRKDLPKSWGGLKGEEFQKVTGVSDAIFCHNALYLCGAQSKEGAIKLAQIALES